MSAYLFDSHALLAFFKGSQGRTEWTKFCEILVNGLSTYSFA